MLKNTFLRENNVVKFFKGFRGLIETAEAAAFQMNISNFSINSKPYAKRL
jgi:hypothetical protein